MKILYTIICLLLINLISVKAQTITEVDHGAYFADFYVMQVKPMQFEINYKFPKTDRVLVRIKDAEQNIIFAEKTLVYKKYHKYFDLSTMQDGQYTFELTDGDEKFVQSFTVSTKTERVARAL
ncbi:hypothetical protein [Dyadobacter arcticus]|uniref:Por secretion system C-terminal sorting domain-containing protein n=1 Tax=Dyadobacter arcticus TaxID=1078754 RepID=A0ABX0UFJ0_9BACT|nr:hypothetical protein [Dyadobacter arcticus]NIJ51768.1 hypothetical protein [Dyadobacter arcticus]